MGLTKQKRTKLLAIDYGERFLGLATSEGFLARSLGVFKIRNKKEAFAKIIEVCRREQPQKVIIGIPLDSEGKPTPQSQRIKNFALSLQKRLGIPVVYWNEILTSKEVLRKMKASKRKRRRVDDRVAALILEEYLEAQRVK